MVQKDCSRDSFTADTAACQRRKRRENCRTITCFSPWSIVSCWFNLEKSKGGKTVKGLQSQDQDPEEGIELGCLHGKSSSSAQEVSGGGHVKDSSLSLGVGFGLIYLLATSKIELNKMAELCKQMETVLQNFKMELQNGGKDTNIDFSCSPSKSRKVSNYAMQPVSLQDCASSSWEQGHSESDITSSSYQNSNSKMKTKGKIVEMDLLEAELEAELEHLQLQLDTEVILNQYPNQKYSEIVVEGSAPEESKTTSFGEVFEQPEVCNEEYYQGVPPRELERRLHELQEVRQQERIRELETALECAFHELEENQTELSWWKDTAKFVFQQIPIRCRSLR
ncbi:hypothetical protein ACH5RR_039474 [Cinchona calisaya]|uniref:Protein POLAR LOCALIZATION DURING ASYMMETRIC DIVISION AND REDISTRIBUTION n=1 Tax=Cinchona calisaya TaxID=153742 RepID=A0ABD2Y0W2_9GENT